MLLGSVCSFRFENPAEKLIPGEARGRAVVEREGHGGTFDPAPGSSVRVRGTAFAIVTRSTGYFALLDLPLGPLTIVFSQTQPVERTLLREIDVQPGSSGQPDGVILGDVTLLYTAAVDGVLVNEQNQPLPFATAVDDVSQLAVTADGAGRFVFPSLAIGRHTLRGWSQPPDGGALVTGGPLEVNLTLADQRGQKTAGAIQLKSASCCGRVKLKLGFIGTGARPSLSQLIVELRRPDGSVIPLTPDSAGNVDDSTVPEGVYEVNAIDPAAATGYQPARLPNVVVVKGAPAEVGALLLVSLQSVQRAQNSCSATEDCPAGSGCTEGQCRQLPSADGGYDCRVLTQPQSCVPGINTYVGGRCVPCNTCCDTGTQLLCADAGRAGDCP